MGMELKYSIELIHISAQHASRESRKKAIADFLRDHPEIDGNEVFAMIGETDLS